MMNNTDPLTMAWYSAVTLYVSIYVDASLCEPIHPNTPQTKHALCGDIRPPAGHCVLLQHKNCSEIRPEHDKDLHNKACVWP